MQVTERPTLDKRLDGKTFRDFYYLKEELIDFCRKNGLPTTGGKLEIANRVACFLDTGRILSASATKKKVPIIGPIHEDSEIEADFVCSERHRAFFKERIGNSFSFNVAFQKWLKSNTGKTYKDALGAYYQILEDKRKGKSQIDKQFEYNTYIRAFFADNQGKSLKEAIQCWDYKKRIQGHNRYERSDLVALELSLSPMARKDL